MNILFWNTNKNRNSANINETLVEMIVERKCDTWKFLSGVSIPYASYYYNSSTLVNYYWNMFDQAILRTEIAESFDINSLMSISKTENHKLL